MTTSGNLHHDFLKRVPQGSLLFAPMEGITDGAYRMSIESAFPEWDYFSTDFLRIPNQGLYSKEKILKHFGIPLKNFASMEKKTAFQILASPNSLIEDNIKKIAALGFQHIDFNAGCPSKKVNSHLGGAYLLQDLKNFKLILKEIRQYFHGLFTVKIRLGFHHHQDFISILKLIEDSGANAITIHARTRDQLYEGKADWSFIKTAVKETNIPIIGNGDCWNLEDIDSLFEQTNCHGVMMGRGALKTPWIATLYNEYKGKTHEINDELIRYQRKEYLDYYFHLLLKNYRQRNLDDNQILKRFKALSRYLFDDYDESSLLKSQFLRCLELSQFLHNLEKLP